MLIFEGSFSGAWLAFVGWFLLQAATAEARYIATEQALEGVRVRDLMVGQPVTVSADMSLGQFMDEVAGRSATPPTPSWTMADRSASSPSAPSQACRVISGTRGGCAM